MATYKQPCMHCGQLISRDVRFCTFCGSRSPFGYACPTCLKPVQREQRVCDGCGRELYIQCPECHALTFVDDKCEKCGQSLMIKCANIRCGEMQFFQNIKCTCCGKKLKKR